MWVTQWVQPTCATKHKYADEFLLLLKHLITLFSHKITWLQHNRIEPSSNGLWTLSQQCNNNTKRAGATKHGYKRQTLIYWIRIVVCSNLMSPYYRWLLLPQVNELCNKCHFSTTRKAPKNAITTALTLRMIWGEWGICRIVPFQIVEVLVKHKN